MVNWDSVINNKVTMGRARSLCLVMNALRKRREGEEERRPGVIPFLGRGIVQVEPRLNQQERVPGEMVILTQQEGEVGLIQHPPPNIFRSQPHSKPCWLAAGFQCPSPIKNQPPIPPCFQLTLSLPKSLPLPFPIPSTPFPKAKWCWKYLLRVFWLWGWWLSQSKLWHPLNYHLTYFFYLLF